MVAEYYFAFFLTSSIALFSLVVFVFAFVKLKAPQIKNIFRLFFFSSLLFAVSQVVLLVVTMLQGFDFNFFLDVNAFFSFILSILLLVTIMDAEMFSKDLLAEVGKK